MDICYELTGKNPIRRVGRGLFRIATAKVDRVYTALGAGCNFIRLSGSCEQAAMIRKQTYRYLLFLCSENGLRHLTDGADRFKDVQSSDLARQAMNQGNGFGHFYRDLFQ